MAQPFEFHCRQQPPPRHRPPARRAARDRKPSTLEGFRLGRVLGVEVAVDVSLLIIFTLIVVNLGAALFPRWHPMWSPWLVWGTAFAAAGLFFVSVLAHELSHAVVAETQGIIVRRITLFLFGGVAHMSREPDSPKAEFLIAIIGPISSLMIGFVATVLGIKLAGQGLALAAATEDPNMLAAALSGVGPVATLLLWLGPVNITLALFNLVPGFPLDGGRVLRSIFWAATRDVTRATRWASRAGQGFALLLVGWGVFNIVSGDFVAGLWKILIGWFLNNAAKLSYQQLIMRQALTRVPVTDVMRTRLVRVSPDVRLDVFVRDYLMFSDQQAFPVEYQGRLFGLIRFSDVSKVPQTEWPRAMVQDVMTPLAEMPALSPRVGAERALEELAQREVEQMPVVDRHRVIGMVGRRDLMKWLSLRSNGAMGGAHAGPISSPASH